MSYRHCAVAMSCLLVAAASALAAPPVITFERIADTNTPIPGGTGNFGFVFDPAVDSGEAAFWGRDTSGRDGIYTNLGDVLQVVGDRFTLIPGGAGTFTSVGGDPMIHDGRVMMVGWGTGGQMGIYTYVDALEVVVDLTVPIPNGSGNFTFTGWPSLNAGILYFLGLGSNNQRGIYSSDLQGNVDVEVSVTTLIPQGTGKFTWFEGPANDGGDLAFRGNGNGAQRGLYHRDAKGLHRIADRTTLWPGAAFAFTDFSTIPGLSDATVAFRGIAGAIDGIFLHADGAIHVIADEATPIPEGTGTFLDFDNYVSNSHGRVAFIASGVATQNGLYVGDRNEVIKVAARNDVLEGKVINQIASIDRDAFDGDEVGFIARFNNGSAGLYIATIASACPEDLDGSGAVDFGDVLAILAAWGNAGGPEDLDGSGTVDFGDVLAVLAAWGPCA